MAGEDKIEGGNRDDEQLHYSSTNLPPDWTFSNPNDLTNTSMSMVTTIWDHNLTNLQNLGAFCDINLQNNPTTSLSSLGFRKRNFDMCWPPSNSAIKRDSFMFIPPPASALLPHSLAQFPANSGFIERAARLSSFSAGNFEDMINPFRNVPESSISLYSSRPIQGQSQDGFVGNGSKDIPLDCGADGSQPKQGGSGVSGNNCSQDENSNEGIGSKKRRSDQDTEHNQVKRSPNEATKNNNEAQHKGNNPNPVPNKSSGKHSKQVSQSSDAQKEDYIHVRARRGQATNSHSLAERVRREKISERMKLLQDLVPGCCKVTGKAVMLDEIINYVQSLQRQVEFLSMKLATVNPRMDVNLEGLLAKDMLESRVGPSGTIGFGADMAMSYNHNQSQIGIIQGGISGVGSSSETVRRTTNSHLMAITEGYKNPTSNLPSSWDDELHNIVQMGLKPGSPLAAKI